MRKPATTDRPDCLLVEVAYATHIRQIIIPVQIEKPCSVQDAIMASGILSQFTEIDLSVNKVGIFGKLCKLNTLLKPRDRVEIYRPLIANPKEQRRKRFSENE